jgi:hypothetical protein
MSTKQLIKKKEENMISGFLEERGGFFLFAGCPPPFSFSLFFFIS